MVVTSEDIKSVYNHFFKFQEAYKNLLGNVLKELPKSLFYNIRDIEYDAACDGTIYINFENWQQMPYDSLDEVVDIFKGIFENGHEAMFNDYIWYDMDPTFNDDEFSIGIRLLSSVRWDE